MLGKLNLTIQADNHEKSVMADMSYTSPLKIMKPLYLDESGTIFIYVMDVSGGMLADDSIHYRILVKKGAKLYLTSTSATKIHPMTDAEKYATIDNGFTVEDNGSLEYFPEELILFENANVTNNTVFELSSSSVLAYSEIILMGRKHFGEIFKFTKLKSNLEIYIDGKIAVWDRFALSPGEGDFMNLGYMEQKSHYGSLYLYAKNSDPSLLEIVRSVISRMESESDPEIQAGSSLHPSGVIVIKVLAHNHYMIKSIFKEIWERVRLFMLKGELPYIKQ